MSVPLLLLLGGCTDDVRIGSPESLWLLWLLPLTAAFFVYVFRTKARLLRRFVSSEMVERLTRGVSRKRQVAKALLVLAGLAASLLALAEIQYGFVWEEIKREGVDIVVALDVSDSMLVQDAESGGKLSRLERAKREIADLLALLEGDRIGLVAFAGAAFIECPLTLDYGAAEIFLDAIDTDLIPVKGTDLARALDTSLAAFEGGSNSSRAIILITDGEDHSGQALAASGRAKVAGVRVFTIGIGRGQGAPIPDARGGFRRDRRGDIVLSRLDEPTLQKIALDTGGRYVRSVTGDVDLEQIYSQGIKATLDDQELGSKRRQRWEERFQWFVGLALVALMLEPLISIRRRGTRAAGAAVVLTASLLAQATAPVAARQAPMAPTATVADPEPEAAGVPASVEDPYEAYAKGLFDQALHGFTDLQVEYPENAEVAFNLGSAHYQMRNFREADEAFLRASLAADEALRQQAIYNLGNSAYRQGRLEDAVELFKRALELDPDDRDAKFNLEFVRDEIRRRHEEARERQQQQEQAGQQQQGDQQQDGEQQDTPPQRQSEEDAEEGQQPSPTNEDESSSPGQDTDQDGLDDETEISGDNPTDPRDADSDDDGLSDGTEDRNRNGRVDAGETDPNRSDSDGDGQPDGSEAGAVGGADATAGQQIGGLTPEEAERYLQALEEGRPLRRLPADAQTRRSEKDW